MGIKRELFNGSSTHNWHFIQYWDFLVAFPNMEDTNNTNSTKEKNNNSPTLNRVVVVEHLKILLKVYNYMDILSEEDINGFITWANNWYELNRNTLMELFRVGDRYPLDFIIWLNNVIFIEKDFQNLFGDQLIERLRKFEYLVDIKN